MNLYTELKNDAKTARLSGADHAKLLTTLIGELETAQKRGASGAEVSDEDVIKTVKKFVKNIDETIAILADKDPERAYGLNAERNVLGEYLPKQMSNDELREFISEKISEGQNLGQVMGSLKKERAGLYDGKEASTIAKEVIEASSNGPEI